MNRPPPVQLRETLKKIIEAAPTFARKWQEAVRGGKPASAIQKLPFDAAHLRHKSGHGPQWQAEAIERLKAKFTDLLFPALMKDEKGPFDELIAAMADCRKAKGNIIMYERSKVLKRKGTERRQIGKPGQKKEAGRRLRLALLNLEPEDRQSIKAVLDFLRRMRVDYSDESHVRRVMRRLGVRLLMPGQKCQWRIKSKLVREIRVDRDGTLKNVGLTRKDLEKVSEKEYRELIPTPAKPDK
jgi:hypothetical protein